MWFSTILGRPQRAATSTRRSRARKVRPFLEPLEDRLTPSTAAFSVTSLADSNTAGSGSLRAAITGSNAVAPAVFCVIDIKTSGTYFLTRNGADEDANATGDLDVLHTVNIVNESGGSVEIDASGLTARDRVFDIAPDGANISVMLSGVSITGGQALAGGGIRVASPADLTLENDFVRNNNAGVGGGGGVFMLDGDLTVTGTSIQENTATGSGGGLFQSGNGRLTITDSGIFSNQSQSTTVGQGGGGVRYDGTGNVNIYDTSFEGNIAAGNGGGFLNTHNALLTISSSTFNNNRSNGDGGGLLLSTQIASTLTNVTISNNVAASIGGGLNDAASISGIITLLNDTIVFNTANTAGGAYAVNTSLRLINTIVAQNLAGLHGQPDVVSAGMVDVANNFIGNNSGSATDFPAGTPNTHGGFVGTAAAPLDPLLAPLALNGTRLHAFTHANQANNGNNGVRDRGQDAGAPTSDERDFPRVAGAHADIGAFEFQNPDMAVSASGPAGTIQAGVPLALTFAVTNKGSIASNGVTLAVTLPAGTAVVSASVGFTVGGNVVTLAVPDLAAGAATTLTLTVTPAAGPFTATAVLGADPNPANNTAAVSLVVLAQAPNERFVSAVYTDVLGRPVDAGSLAYWAGQLDHGLLPGQFASILTNSAEYYATIILPAYQQFLGRPADSVGLAFWINQMQHGLTDEQLEAGFIGSPEYYQHAGGTDRLWVDAMYLNLLGRGPDGQGESFWVSQLAAGVRRASVAYGFAASAEREGIIVQADYRKYLGRGASGGEVAFWVNAFAHGVTNEQVVAGFVGSPEYFQEHTS